MSILYDCNYPVSTVAMHALSGNGQPSSRLKVVGVGAVVTFRLRLYETRHTAYGTVGGLTQLFVSGGSSPVSELSLYWCQTYRHTCREFSLSLSLTLSHARARARTPHTHTHTHTYTHTHTHTLSDSVTHSHTINVGTQIHTCTPMHILY